jgi:CheY-like chemotaxis protein
MSPLLVVEDAPAFRALITRELAGWGHEVVEAGSMAEAMERAGAHRPETAIVDIGLPDGNGFDLTVSLLALPWAMRVIVTSADTGAGNHEAARRAGAVRFVPKDELFSADVRRLVA